MPEIIQEKERKIENLKVHRLHKKSIDEIDPDNAFKPRLITPSPLPKRSLPQFLKDTSLWDENRKKHIEKVQMEVFKSEFESITFVPKINEKSKRIIEKVYYFHLEQLF